jgi:RNA polymerase sigma-70 factor (ECF subfamily)
MSDVPSRDVTALLRRWREGDPDAQAEVYSVLYEELRRQARGCMRREPDGHTLQTTALVHEAFLRIAGAECPDWQHRVHFLAVAARAMRRVLIDMARSRRAGKRGGRALHLPFDTSLPAPQNPAVDLLALDEALEGLARLDTRKAEVVELRFFGGLTNEEIGAVLNISTDTVMRDWRLARAWLHRILTADDAVPS